MHRPYLRKNSRRRKLSLALKNVLYILVCIFLQLLPERKNFAKSQYIQKKNGVAENNQTDKFCKTKLDCKPKAY